VFFACGGAMLLFVAAGPWIVDQFGDGALAPAAAASGLLTILAASLSQRVDGRVALAAILLLALAMRLLLVGQETYLSNDIYRYIWDGRVQAAGINPYLHVPADPALAHLRDFKIFRHINRADYAVTAYPPVAEMLYFAITRIAETTLVMRLAMVGFEVVIILVLLDLTRLLALPRTTIVAYAWHPLAIWEVANSGHIEAAMVALLMTGVWLLLRARRVLGAIAVTLAALVKPYAVLVFPAFWRPFDWRVPLAIIATVLLCYAPYYLGAGKAVLGFSSGYIAEEGLASGDGILLVAAIQSWLGPVPGLVIAYVVMAGAIMIALGLYYRFDPQRTPRQTIDAIVVLLTVGLLLVSPNYAWYFLALVPFIALGAGPTAWALTLGALHYRPVYFGETNDLIWKSLATLPFVLTLSVVLLRRIVRAQGFRRAA
jgi:hypothetical protein